MIEINGAFGEGGGQILRTAIGLSLLTGQAFTIKNIRGGRKKPGLKRQHLTAVKAAQEISNAGVDGAVMSSAQLIFKPGKVKPGAYRFAVGTAGSATLVLQTLLPALLTGSGDYGMIFEGGTHNPFAPPYDFLEESFFGVLKKMGAQLDSQLTAYGFYPAGGGAFRVKITSVDKLAPFNLADRGEVLETGAHCMVSMLPVHIAQKEAKIVARKLQWEPESCRAETVTSSGPGNIILLKVRSQNITGVFTGFGEKSVPLKTVANKTVLQAKNYLDNNLVVDMYLADQLLIPMAIAGGGTFVTGEPSLHTLTNIEVIKQFTGLAINCNAIDEQRYEISL